MPDMITDLVPAFKACKISGRGVWDPPIAFPSTSEITPLTAMGKPTHTRPEQKTTPMPGSYRFGSGTGPSMTGRHDQGVSWDTHGTASNAIYQLTVIEVVDTPVEIILVPTMPICRLALNFSQLVPLLIQQTV